MNLEVDNIYLQDCVEGMAELRDNSADLLIADPPYNASKGNPLSFRNPRNLPNFGGDWQKIMADWDSLPLFEYWKFTVAWLEQAQRVVRPSGSMWVHGTFHNSGPINFAMQLLGIEIINEVVWYKRNSFPNLSGRRLTASHETILWAHTGVNGRNYYFDYKGSKLLTDGADNLKKPGKQLRTVWDLPNNKKREELKFGRHPAQKPIRLIKRILRISSKPGQLVVIPFSGMGSECVAAKELDRRFIAFEKDPMYHKLATDRLSATVRQMEL